VLNIPNLNLKPMIKLDLIVLAGGFGTRLQSVSKGIPKALLPIDKGVFIDKIFDNAVKNQIGHIYLSLHYQSEAFDKYLLNSVHKDIITKVVEPEPLGTGGAIKYVIESNNVSDPFIVINGDTLSSTNLDKMKSRFFEKDNTAMIAVSHVDNAGRYGAVKFEDNKVLDFIEKGNYLSGWINNGHYILKKEIFDTCDGSFSIECELFPDLVKKNYLSVYPVEDDRFLDIGIPDDYNFLLNNYGV
jgi:D-glycero-alpha-D-manno-heptose 1-phosphate guanylyltransferase